MLGAGFRWDGRVRSSCLMRRLVCALPNDLGFGSTGPAHAVKKAIGKGCAHSHGGSTWTQKRLKGAAPRQPRRLRPDFEEAEGSGAGAGEVLATNGR